MQRPIYDNKNQNTAISVVRLISILLTECDRCEDFWWKICYILVLNYDYSTQIHGRYDLNITMSFSNWFGTDSDNVSKNELETSKHFAYFGSNSIFITIYKMAKMD